MVETEGDVDRVDGAAVDPLEAWQQHITNTLRDRDGIINMMKSNRKRREKLEADYQRLTISQGYTLKELYNSVNVYSQLLCRPLCEKMFSKLPRELRDRIYEYILGPRTEQPIDLTKLVRQRRKEPFFVPSCVGHEFAVEIWEMAFRTDNILLCSSFHLHDVLLLPQENGVLPYEFIRSLTVRVHLGYRFCFDRCCAVCNSSSLPPLIPRPPPAPPLPPPSVPTPPAQVPCGFTCGELLKSFEPLLSLKHKEGFDLRIWVGGHYVDEQIGKVLRRIEPIIRQLMQDGVKVSIQNDPTSIQNNRTPEELMCYYDGEHEDWPRVCREHRERLKSKGKIVFPPSPPSPPTLPPPPPLPPLQVFPAIGVPPDSDTESPEELTA